VELYPHLRSVVLRKPYVGELTTSTLTHGSYHVLLPHFEISQVSEHKTSITLLFIYSSMSHRRPHPDIVAVFDCKGKK